MIANEIKRNLTNLEETLNKCSIESRTRYDGDANEMKIQLEKMMVKIFYLFAKLIHLFFRMWKNVLIISQMFIRIQ